MTTIAFFWLSLALIFLLLEMGHPGLFFFLSFFFGSLVSFAIQWIPTLSPWHIEIFFLATAISFLLLKVWVKKKLQHAKKTNVHALIGKRGFVLATISTTQAGLVKIGGEIWSAKSKHGTEIAQGALVEVVHTTGAHLIVVELHSLNN